jgi:hypothetical protein
MHIDLHGCARHDRSKPATMSQVQQAVHELYHATDPQRRAEANRCVFGGGKGRGSVFCVKPIYNSGLGYVCLCVLNDAKLPPTKNHLHWVRLNASPLPKP